ncbi:MULTISPECIES: hypothetical protein [Vibrio]|uniref:hypothetical protein n=1 Tax=Vibrio TaxID=662 RepID=UPI0020750E86|nr:MULTISPECIES: hypothetical protein [Vibrio]USD33174.1 hypothetical protein J8Z27_03430 [Vibrio sp. SCSIO 43186]USD46243.1 hypothetical protein J4N38_03605 [Vibrio sp. SCSIO 43145]USD70298.1 hypothetical protein J4N41_03430 [Vibrio sp. SCSIO 43139]USD95213.1 hypothetical protein CTT30_03500 [Vibrio coralliilyticus]
MKKQSGAALIVMTCLLLSVTLMVIMGSYKGVFYQVKRSNNELDSRTAHWLAEGGLECAFASVSSEGLIPESLNGCQGWLGLDGLEIETGTPHKIRSSSGFLTLSKAFFLPELQIKSAMTTTAHLYVYGSLNLAPHHGDKVSENEWACVSLRYQNEVYAQSYSSKQPKQRAVLPRYFPLGEVENQQHCADKNYTGFAWQLSSTQDDFALHENLDPFKEVFNVSRNHWFDVMSDTGLFGYVPSSLASFLPANASDLPAPQVIEDCGEKISELIKASHEFIWVYGSCELTSDDLQTINGAIDTYLAGGLVLVLHNGAFAVSGHQALKALVYHFVSDDSALDDAGLETIENDELSVNLTQTIDALSSVVAIEKERVSYFQSGSFYPIGGLILDVPERYALIDTSLDTEFNQDITASPARKHHQTLWVRGSWYDF